MMKHEIVQNLYEELGLIPPDWVPDEYIGPIKNYSNLFSTKNQLPFKDSDEVYLYPIDINLVENRVGNQVMRALMDCVDVSETKTGVELLLTKNPKYPVMLNGSEERALCKAIQDSAMIENNTVRESVRNSLVNIAITFLSPRIKFIYRKFEKAVTSYNAYEDVIQEMMLAMLKMLEEFNFERTTAGLTKDYVNTRMFKAINLALAANRSSSMAQETWNKVMKFVNTPEDHNLTREELREKYHCSSGLVDVMFSFVQNGSLEISISHVPTDVKNSSAENKDCTIGDMIPSKDYAEEKLDIGMTLRRILPEVQYEIVKMKLCGYSHQAIADALGFDSKRKSQYLFLCARNAIQKEFNVDIEQYSKGQCQYRRRLRTENALKDNEFLPAEDIVVEDDFDDEDDNNVFFMGLTNEIL